MIFYHGTNEPSIILENINFIWLSVEKDIANQYGNFLFKIDADFDNLKIASISDLIDAASFFDCDFDEILYNPSIEFINILKNENIDAYFIDSYFENFCLFNKKRIKTIIAQSF